MSIKKLWGTRTRATASTYIGERGTLFYNEVDGELRLSDGVTPGGVAIAVRADLITAGSLLPDVDNDDTHDLGSPTKRWHHLYIGDGGIKFDSDAYPVAQTVPYIPGAQVDDIIPGTDNDINLGAADKRFANIYLGTEGLFLADQTTDENINITVDEGTLYIDGAENLRLGNLAIRDTTLTSATSDLDISIGDAGDTGYFYVKRKAQIDNTTFSATEAMLSVNASGGPEPLTLFPDTLIQATGRPDKNSRVVQRSYGSSGTVGGDNAYAVWASYAARGTVAAPAALKENDILARLSANGYGTTAWGSGGARVEFVALENFTDAAKGSAIKFWTVPEGQVASQNVATINSVGVVATGIKFSGDETVQTTAGIPLTQKAIPSASYVATLGIDGKLDSSQIPSSLSGAVVFKGVWNATTNTPALSDTTPEGLLPGWEYIVEVGGTRDIGDGSKVFVSGDFVIYDGTHWKQVPSGNLFTSLTGGGGITVNQSTGAMVLGSTATALSTNSAIVSRDSSGNFAANMITANLTGAVTGSVSGNAGSVTNGFYTTSSFNLGTTSIAVNRASASQSLTGISIDGNAGTVTNGVYTNGSYANPAWITSLAGSKVTNAVLTTDTGTVTNTMLAGSIANNKLANSTISGIALGSNLAALTIDGYLIGTSYNGSTGITMSVDATTAGTANKVVARDANAIVAGSNFQGTVRDAGAVGGGTLTLNFNSDSIVKCTTASSFTIAYSNITAGRNITVLITNTSAGGGNETATLGVDEANCTTGTDAGGVATCTLANASLTVLNIYSIGTTTADVYVGAIPGTT